MKKQLLLAAFLMGSFLTANAQTLSFESGEGYAAGDINGQNGWTVSETEEGVGIANFSVSTERATAGSNSLAIAQDPDFNPSTTGVTFGAFGPEITEGYEQVVLSFDFYTTVTDQENGANYAVQLQSIADDNVTSRLEFGFDGSISVVDVEGGAAPAYIETDATWTADTWHHVNIYYDFGAGTINYEMDGNVIYEGTVWAAASYDGLVFLTDNWPGSTANFDNFVFTEGTVAGLKGNAISKLSVFPNPANDIVTIAAADALVNNVSIVDINGRTVKSVKFDGLANTQVNVSDLAKGVYVMTISSDKGTTTQKLMKN